MQTHAIPGYSSGKRKRGIENSVPN